MKMLDSIDTKLKAFGFHLTVSAVILLILLTIIFLFWFPHELIFAGGIDGLKILVSVDMVLGPLLTLIVFNRQKASLRFDLTVIATIQFVCMAGGLWIIYNERPVAQVIADDGIHLISASELKFFKTDLSHLKGSKPAVFLLDLPEQSAEIAGIKFATAFTQNKPFSFRSDLYIPINEVEPQTLQDRTEFILSTLSDEKSAEIENLSKHNNCHWLPVISKHYIGFTCFDSIRGATKLSRSHSASQNNAQSVDPGLNPENKRSD